MCDLLGITDLRRASEQAGSPDYFPLFAGQGLGLIRDIPSAADVVRSVVQEAERALDTLPRRVGRG